MSSAIRLCIVGVLALVLFPTHAAVGTSRVDALFAQWDKPDTPGCAVGINEAGQTILQRGYGQASLEHPSSIDEKTVFNVGSVSKQFTAAAIAVLEQRGKLSLDDAARKYVPELPRFMQGIRLRHLLYHTSGLRDFVELRWLAGQANDNYYTTQETLRLVTRQKRLNFVPGTRHMYSNTGYFLLGLVIERISGQSLEQFSEENLFAPLGMSRTHVHARRSRIVPGRAAPYYPDGAGFGIDAPSQATGSSGVMSDVEDMLLWDGAFDRNEMVVASLPVEGKLDDGKPVKYGAGIETGQYRGLRTFGHDGRDGGFESYYVRFPDQRFGVVILCNNEEARPARLALRIADMYLSDRLVPAESRREAKANPASVPFTTQEITPMLGWYRFNDAPNLRSIALEQGKIFYRRNATSRSELEYLGNGRFRMLPVELDTEIVFTPATSTAAAGLRVIARGAVDTLLTAFAPTAYTPSEIADISGDYVDDEFGYRMHIDTRSTATGSEIRAHISDANPTLNDLLLQPGLRDEFSIDWSVPLTVSILRDGHGRVLSIRLDGDRVRDLRFLKHRRR